MNGSNRYDSLFQYYAGEYGLDWRLVKKQAIAESSLRPNAVSPAGAIGLMQFMPGTWSQWGEGDPTNPEQSIKAGCKYMAHLCSLWTEIPDEAEKYRFALASYNAGRQNIRLCVAEARKGVGAPYSHDEWAAAGRLPGPWQSWAFTRRFLPLVTGTKSTETINYVDKILPPEAELWKGGLP